MYNRVTVLCLTTLFAASCATVDVEKDLRTAAPGKIESLDDLPVTIRLDPEIKIIEIERPVFVPETEINAPRPPISGVPAVQESNAAGIIKPSEYSHAAMIYDYDPNWVYEVYTQPLRASDIIIEPGELILEPPFISDGVRWILGAGVSYEHGMAIQHIYVKPAEPGITASLIINTDRRVYHIILRSYNSTHMPIVRWRYNAAALPVNYIQPPSAAPQNQQNNPDTDLRPATDARFLSFNYKIAYRRLRKPSWLPKLVFDDGAKTYITFPESVLNRELPAVFENRKDVLNYRVIDNLVIIDKLIDSITIKIERIEITISKKRST